MKNRVIVKNAMAIVTIICGLMAVSNAQNGHVSGRVFDKETGETMPFVNVALMRPVDTVFMRGATTDMDGRFNIEGVDTGRYLLQASFVGYITYINNLDVIDDLDNLDIRLQRGTTLEEVQVTAEKPLYLMDGEKNMYNTKQDPSIQTGTASDALQNAPGVEVDAEGNITLRGVSSVEIWINDQPSHMNEEALKQYIKTLPANAIERIEVITNPSARYSTNGGVINIVTNQKIARNELLCVGVRGNVSPDSRPMLNNISPWMSYVWANEKVDFNVYLNGSYSRHDSRSEGTSTLKDSTGAMSRFQEYYTDNQLPYYGGYAGLNFNWKIDSMTNLSAWLGAYPYWDDNTFYSRYTYIEYNPYSDRSYFDTTQNHGFSSGAYGGAWFEHRYDTTGRKLSINFSGNYWSNGGYSDVVRDYADIALVDFRRHMTGRYFGPHLSVGADYVLPLKNKIELEAGVNMGYSYNINNEDRDSLNADGSTWDNMVMQSYHAKGRGWEPSAYMTVLKRWGGFTGKLGLRAQDVYMMGELSHTAGVGDTAPTKNFFGLIPSVHLSYQTKNFTSYSLSYARRFSDDEDLLNYTNFRMYDDYSYRTGNPNLLRTYTHNLEAAFNKYVMGFGNIGVNAYFRANRNEVGTMPFAGYDFEVFDSLLVNYTKPVNIGSSHTEGIEANITYRPTGFFNVRLNTSVFNYGYDYNGFKDSRISWSARLNVWAKVWNKLEVFANARYSSPRLGLYSISVPNYSIDFGLSSDFFERRLSAYLNVNDLFGWGQWGTNTTAPQYQTTGSTRYNTRYISLGLTWRIGKMELESKARQGATDNAPQM